MKSNRWKLLMKFVLPTVLGQVSFFLFSIVDGIFVGNGVGTDALGAVNILFPFIMVVGALSTMIVVGGSTITAIALGRQDAQAADRTFMHTLLCVLVFALLMTALGTCLTRPIGVLLGANEVYIDYVCDYLFWFSAFIVPSTLSMFFQFFCRNDGAPTLVMVSSVLSSALNILLDWLFVFPLGMGLRGAAIATGISQTVSMFLVLSHFLGGKSGIRFRLTPLRGGLIREILLRGFPEAVAQLATPVSVLCTNYVLLSRIGEIGVNAYSVIGYTASFSVAIFAGVAEGAQPLFGQSCGAGRTDDLRCYFRYSRLLALGGSVAVFALLTALRVPLCRLFGLDGETLSFTVAAMPRYSVGFVVMAQNSILSAYLYSTARTREASVLNLLRSVLFAPLTILLLPRLGDVLVWYTFAVYELLSLLLGLALLRVAE